MKRLIFTLVFLAIGATALADDVRVFSVERVSVAADGTQGNGISSVSVISEDGRYVAFHSNASNLVLGDTNRKHDVFVHDRKTGQTSRVSVASDGSQGNDVSWFPDFSGDGRYVVFVSNASNLVLGDTNDAYDIFVHDRQTGKTNRVSVASDGAQGNFLSYDPFISGDGRYVAFYSAASNLVPGDTNGKTDIFVHDRQTGKTSRVSVASNGTQSNNDSEHPTISGDNRYVAFHSLASNLVSGDTNDWSDIFVHDRQTGQTTRVSVAFDGSQSNGLSWYANISRDGRYVAFVSDASNLVPGDTNGKKDVFLHDLQTGQTIRVSVDSDGTQGDDASLSSSLSGDGRYVAFGSMASNLVPGDTNGKTDIFVHDRQIGQTTRVSVAADGTQGNNYSYYPVISVNGRHVTFAAGDSNLVSGDTNVYSDVFVASISDQHMACVDNTCSLVDGVGVDSCSSDADCAAPGNRQPPPPPVACTSYTYSAWGACQSSNTQTRTVISSFPSGCAGGTAPVLSQRCTYVPPPPSSCTDSDGGDGPTKAGQVKTRSPAGIFNDSCFTDPRRSGNFLKEYLCQGSQAKVHMYKCNKCSNGIGKICTSDGGLKPAR